ncbi:hypothetical protein M569_14566, partial [Genlisea aurea]
KNSTGETPFSLVYGSEAVAPVESLISSPRTTAYVDNEAANAEMRELDIDLMEEKRQEVYERVLRQQHTLQKYYNKRVMPRQFAKGDLVLRSVQSQGHRGKLDRAWEGPYRVYEPLGRGAYRL